MSEDIKEQIGLATDDETDEQPSKCVVEAFKMLGRRSKVTVQYDAIVVNNVCILCPNHDRRTAGNLQEFTP